MPSLIGGGIPYYNLRPSGHHEPGERLGAPRNAKAIRVLATVELVFGIMLFLVEIFGMK